ncbi:MAG: hypothetical protein IPL28_22655 [Chloroflexi bacterium]|nr:hypothetical protein [Chloroflexota bacterium]
MPTPKSTPPKSPRLARRGEIVPQLEEAWQVQEYEFQSEARWVGKLVAQFRTAWNNVASRWSVRHAIAQQITSIWPFAAISTTMWIGW